MDLQKHKLGESPSMGVMMCSGETCSVCQHVNKQKHSFLVKLGILWLDIQEAFKKFFKKI